jgi:glycosyltransferase 2 family protein
VTAPIDPPEPGSAADPSPTGGTPQHPGEPVERSASARTGLTGARPWRRHAVELATGGALLLLSWALLDESRHVVPGWETDVFHAVNDLPDALRWPVWPVMQLGNVWMLAVGAIIAYLVTRRIGPALAVVAAVLMAWVLARVIKDTIDRGRPGDLLADVHLRESGIHGRGYVSGHAAVAFAVATVLTPLLPGRWRYLPFALALVVAFARVYYGAHLPLDVIGGAGLGILCGLVASAVFGIARPGRGAPAER